VSSDDQALAWASEFEVPAPPVSVRRFGSGHLNATYLVTDAAGGHYVLQRVNTYAFREPINVMENILRVTEAIAKQVSDPRRRLSLVPSRSGRWWCGEADECWRMYNYIDGSMELVPPASPEEFAAVGQALGDFLVQVSVIPA